MAHKKNKVRNAKNASRAQPKRTTSRSGVSRKSKGQVLVFPEDLYTRWLAHGLNCMLSDYDRGIWKPVLEEVYTEPSVSRDLILQRVQDSKGPLMQVALGWLAASQGVHRIFFHEVLRQLQTDDPEAIFRPHEPVSWKMIHSFQQKLLTMVS
jgi:hypothetical protein